jgi:type I restriction enzyme M protein
MRSAHNPGPTNDQEAQQEEFLGALKTLGGSAGNGRLRELLGWEEAPYEAVKASLLASGRVRTGRGRGGSVSLADGVGDEGADGHQGAVGSVAVAGGSAREAGASVAEAGGGQGAAFAAPLKASARAAAGPSPLGPQPTGKQNLSAFIWSVADILRGDYKQSDYGKVILPFTVLRRLDCVLEPSKEAVLAEKELREGQGLNPEPFLLRVAGQGFCNTSALGMKRLMGDQDNIGENLRSYIQAFTPAVRDIFESFSFTCRWTSSTRPGCCTWCANASPRSICTRKR